MTATDSSVVGNTKYVTSMQFTAERLFKVTEENHSKLAIKNNEDYVLCVDSWLNRGNDVIRTKSGCGIISIDLPEEKPDPPTGGSTDNTGGKDGEVDGTDGTDGTDGGVEKTGASSLVYATALVALSMLAF